MLCWLIIDALVRKTVDIWKTWGQLHEWQLPNTFWKFVFIFLALIKKNKENTYLIDYY
jgi:hypothetical protein